MFGKTEVKAEVLLAAAFGLSFGIITYLILRVIAAEGAVLFALFSSALSFLGLYVCLRVHSRRMGKRYAAFEKSIRSPVFFRTNTNIRVGGKQFNANIYLCEAGILLVSLDEKPYRLQKLTLPHILQYEAENLCVSIYTRDGAVFRILTPDAQSMVSALKEKGWIQACAAGDGVS